MSFHTKHHYAGRTLVVGQIVLTMTSEKTTWAQLTYIESDPDGREILLFAVHFTAYPVPLEFVDSIDKLSEGKWCWTPKPS